MSRGFTGGGLDARPLILVGLTQGKVRALSFGKVNPKPKTGSPFSAK